MNALTLESAITAASALQTSLASPDAAARATDRMDQRFLEMLRLYRTRGGLAREEEVVRRMSHCASRPRRDCEPGHAHDSVIRLAWGGTAWLPLFQFCKEDMTVRAETARVVIELAPVFDGWAIAEWVTAPNSWLLNRPPIDVLDSHIQAVIDAAREDRFIAEQLEQDMDCKETQSVSVLIDHADPLFAFGLAALLRQPTELSVIAGGNRLAAGSRQVAVALVVDYHGGMRLAIAARSGAVLRSTTVSKVLDLVLSRRDHEARLALERWVQGYLSQGSPIAGLASVVRR